MSRLRPQRCVWWTLRGRWSSTATAAQVSQRVCDSFLWVLQHSFAMQEPSWVFPSEKRRLRCHARGVCPPKTSLISSLMLACAAVGSLAPRDVVGGVSGEHLRTAPPLAQVVAQVADTVQGELCASDEATTVFGYLT